MRKIGFKALAALLTMGRHAKRPINSTLAIAIISTMVTFGLVALYLTR
ncbi:MAG TPA: hypothetical protein VKT76_09335 [Bradyrhizobium sp.]|nr:hypothetical protein [Bradyrhizobium sp.]